MSIIKGTTVTIETNSTAGVTKRVNKKWIRAKANYVKGGTTFTFPSGYFSGAPMVSITIQLLGMSYSTSKLLSPVVTFNDKTKCTVRVNKVKEEYVNECSNDSVIVYLHAIEW